MLDADMLFNQAVTALERGNLALAVDRLKRVLAQKPNDREAALMLAQTERDLGNFDAAEQALVSMLKSTHIPDDDIPLWTELADLRLARGDAAAAARACNHVLKVKPQHAETLYLLGNAFFDVGAFEEAARAYAASLATNPFDAETWHNYGAVLERLNRHDEAAEAIDKWHRLSAREGLGPPPDFSTLDLDDGER
jgi:tetratricopeptide (TPR) repeat protein